MKLSNCVERIFIPLLILVSISLHGQVGKWGLNNNATDASGNNLNGTLIGSPSFSTDAKEGSHSIAVTGTQYVDLSNPSILPSGRAPRTISAWAKTTTTSGDHTIASYGTNANSQAFYIAQSGTSLVAGGFSNNITVNNFWATNTWRHICLTYDGSTARLYADGQLVSTAAKVWNTILSRAYIGRHVTNGNYWAGNIDDVRIYDKALTDQEVLALFTASPAIPAPPSTLSATAVSTSQIDLSWQDNSTNETGFQIERSTSSSSNFLVVNTTSSNATTYSDKNLSKGTTYYYRVSAANASGVSTYAATFATTLTDIPVTPTNLQVTTITPSSISLSWTDNSTNETGFQVERSTSDTGPFSIVGTTSTNTISFTDNAISQVPKYYYRVAATGIGGNSAYTPLVTALLQPSPSLVGIWKFNNNSADESGNGLNGSLIGSPVFSSDRKEGTHSIALNGSSQYIDLFNPALLPSGTNPKTISAWAKTSTTTGDHIIVSYGTNANSQAFYIGQSGTALVAGGFSNNLTVANFWAANTWRHICLTYDGVTARLYADGVEVASAGKVWNTVLSRAYIGRHVTNGSLWSGNIDDVRVYNKAFTAADVLALITPVKAPTTLSVRANDDKSVTLQWSDISVNETGFQIERKVSGGNYALVATAPPDAQHFVSADLAPNTTYFFRIRAIANEGNSNWVETQAVTTMTATTAAVNSFNFQYQYDSKKRMIAKKVPGADWVYLVYDDLDRVVMTQDGNQRDGKDAAGNPTPLWSWTRYDQLNRPILTGIYRHNTLLTQQEMSQLISKSIFYETRTNQSEHGYTNNVFGSSNFQAQNFEVLTATYYDDYSAKDLIQNAGSNDQRFNYAPCELPSQYAFKGSSCADKISMPLVKGLVTVSKTKVLNSDTWLWSVNYYDDRGRVVQSVASNILGGIDRTTSTYDMAGHIIFTKNTHINGTNQSQTIVANYEYDHSFRVKTIRHNVNGTAVTSAANEYNELGQIVTKKLHSTDGQNFKQKIDYRYNIRGWLESINDIATAETADLFAMNLSYTTPTLSGISAQFNGNISQMDWQGPEREKSRYGFVYDPMNRLKEARYYNASNPLKNGRFNERIISYDHNGNIQSLRRKGKSGTNSSGVTTYGMMDSLSYSYRGNQLQKVSDLSTASEGFADGPNSDSDYLFDNNGSTITDKNKGIGGIATSSGNSVIVYNHLNLPQQVVKNSGEYIMYTYDAVGRKLKQQVFNTSNTLTKTSLYIGDFFYEGENASPKLLFANMPEGRVILAEGSVPEFQYFLKDHLGNVRVTFTSMEESNATTATFEQSAAATETGDFVRYSNARKVNYYAFDRTNGSRPSTTPGYAQRLSGGTNEKYGIARSLSVLPGDKIRAEVYAKYVDRTSANRSTDLNNFLTAVAAAISTGATTSGTVIDGSAFSSSTASFPLGTLAAQNTAGSTSTGPKAYLNWLVFDADYNFIQSKSGYARLSAAPRETGIAPNLDVAHEKLESGEIVIDKPGFVYIFISNEETTPLEVYFDDFTVTQNYSPVIQTDDYYPFGLTFNSYSRDNSLAQEFKFQGQEHIDELNLGWDSFKWRNHMPDIGRFFNIDPLADKYVYNSPYAFSENHIVVHRELEGLEKVYIFDQANNPDNKRVYTADVYVQQNDGTVKGPYKGSSYPNNDQKHNTLNTGTHSYNNESGHKGSSRKGLNIVNDSGDRVAPGTTPSGGDVTMSVVNVHSGQDPAENNNQENRGSEGCPTIKPSDAEAFFSNFDWSGSKTIKNKDGTTTTYTGTTGTSTGTVTVFRGESDESANQRMLLELQQSVDQALSEFPN